MVVLLYAFLTWTQDRRGWAGSPTDSFILRDKTSITIAINKVKAA